MRRLLSISALACWNQSAQIAILWYITDIMFPLSPMYSKFRVWFRQRYIKTLNEIVDGSGSRGLVWASSRVRLWERLGAWDWGIWVGRFSRKIRAKAKFKVVWEESSGVRVPNMAKHIFNFTRIPHNFVQFSQWVLWSTNIVLLSTSPHQRSQTASAPSVFSNLPFKVASFRWGSLDVLLDPRLDAPRKFWCLDYLIFGCPIQRRRRSMLEFTFKHVQGCKRPPFRPVVGHMPGDLALPCRLSLFSDLKGSLRVRKLQKSVRTLIFVPNFTI